MTYITDKLDDLIAKEYKKGPDCNISFMSGLVAAKIAVVDAEVELQERIQTAWENEGVEPR